VQQQVAKKKMNIKAFEKKTKIDFTDTEIIFMLGWKYGGQLSYVSAYFLRSRGQL